MNMYLRHFKKVIVTDLTIVSYNKKIYRYFTKFM